jgi:hypothetical protein
MADEKTSQQNGVNDANNVKDAPAEASAVPVEAQPFSWL